MFLAHRSAERREAEAQGGGAANRSQGESHNLLKDVAQEWRSLTSEEVSFPPLLSTWQPCCRHTLVYHHSAPPGSPSPAVTLTFNQAYTPKPPNP